MSGPRPSTAQGRQSLPPQLEPLQQCIVLSVPSARQVPDALATACPDPTSRRWPQCLSGSGSELLDPMRRASSGTRCTSPLRFVRREQLSHSLSCTNSQGLSASATFHEPLSPRVTIGFPFCDTITCEWRSAAERTRESSDMQMQPIRIFKGC
jgi:hypothetical protein